MGSVSSEQMELIAADFQSGRLLTTDDVARLFKVDPKTVTRWARGGQLASVRTPGGHRRFSETQVRQFLADIQYSPRLPKPREPLTSE